MVDISLGSVKQRATIWIHGVPIDQIPDGAKHHGAIFTLTIGNIEIKMFPQTQEKEEDDAA